MSTEPLNTLPIIQFLQQVKQADLSKSKEIRMPIDNARALAFTMGIVMARLEGDLEKIIIKKLDRPNDDNEIKINLDTGSNWQ